MKKSQAQKQVFDHIAFLPKVMTEIMLKKR